MRLGLLPLFALTCALALPGCRIFRSDDTSTEIAPIPPEIAATNAPHAAPAPVMTNAPLVVIDRPSPNFDRRRLPVSMIVLHYTAAPLRESLNTLTDPKGRNRVSAHYVVAKNGTVFRLVDESKRAWHAGVSSWKGIRDVNSASIGIEIVNLGELGNGRNDPFPAVQIDSVVRLCRDIMSRHAIRDVVGHADVAPVRKVDPGPLFPWRQVRARLRRPAKP